MIESAFVPSGEAATMLGVKRRAIWDMIEKGRIPQSAIYPRVNGGRVLISRAWILNHQPANITSITDVRRERLTEVEAEMIADRVAEKLWARMFGKAAV